ncbi:protein disulfide isomerase CRELD2 isoform X2 [Zalophus californianus]|uniref:Protein disulfide isomerase CRELD2 isoform X2 n=1 Tax=Zalophus californianus TaxID=9704 RepID=A0A6J2CX03_ZALCA|nr:protein disulfide isomerase CRELD2 isoform X2 [Zalophus californianus]
MGTGWIPRTNSGARAGGGRDPARRRQVAPGTAGTAERWAAAEAERSAGFRCTSALPARLRPAQRCPPRPAMRPPAPSAMGLLLLLLLPPPPPPAEAAKKATPCKRCRELVHKFNQGMVDTAKKNFGGGNTAWEEKSLSKYEFSEVRLLEITESLCGSSDFECHSLLEEHEEHLEAWWLQLKKEYPDLFEWFCVKTLKVCCSPGTYGPDCLACQGGSERPCSGNGHCSGDGSRQGDGSCQCHLGYQGATCTDCVDGYFSSLRNETHSVCAACDESCKTCTGPTSRDCGQCAAGWLQEDGACVGRPWPWVVSGHQPCHVHGGPGGLSLTAAVFQMWTSVRQRRLPAVTSSTVRMSTARSCAKNVIQPVWAARGRVQDTVKSASLATPKKAASVQT